MKNALILFSLIVLMACSKKQPITTAPTTPKQPIYSAANFAGTYKCSMTGTLDMTYVNSYPCHTGHRSLNDTSFTCVIGNYSAQPGYCAMTADSIMGNRIRLVLTSDKTFDATGFIYQPKGCAVGFYGSGNGSVSGNTITITHDKFDSDISGTQDQHFVITMIRQ